jgi:ribosomal protein L33
MTQFKKDYNILESSRIDGIPIFIFSAKDYLTLQVLEYYRDLCIEEGCDIIHIDTINERITGWIEWQKVNPTKLPDTKQEQLGNFESTKNQFTVAELVDHKELVSHMFLTCVPKEKLEAIAKRVGDWEKNKTSIKIDVIVDGEPIDTREFFNLFHEQAEKLVRTEAKELLAEQCSDMLDHFQSRMQALGEIMVDLEKNFNWDIRKNPFEKENICNWRKIDHGSLGCDSWEYTTDCGKNYDVDKTQVGKYCPNCGKPNKINLIK